MAASVIAAQMIPELRGQTPNFRSLRNSVSVPLIPMYNSYMKRLILILVVEIGITLAAPGAVARKDPEPLAIARQGYFFAGGKYSNDNSRNAMSGQLYVEFQIPAKQTHAWPIVMIHGGSQTGTNFTGTPDGREGWAQYFVRRGHAVYVVDQVARGRWGHYSQSQGPVAQANLPRTEQR